MAKGSDRKRAAKLDWFNSGKPCVICQKPFLSLDDISKEHIVPKFIKLNRAVCGMSHLECNNKDSIEITRYLNADGLCDCDLFLLTRIICGYKIKYSEIRMAMLETNKQSLEYDDMAKTLVLLSSLRVRHRIEKKENVFDFMNNDGKTVKTVHTYKKAKMFAEGIQLGRKLL